MYCLAEASPSRFPLFHEDIELSSYQVSKEPLKPATDTIRYFQGIVGLAHFIYDVAKRILQLFLCCWTRPWPRWSWTTTILVKDELITLKKESGALKSHEFFRHLLEQAHLPFVSSQKGCDAGIIASDLV